MSWCDKQCWCWTLGVVATLDGPTPKRWLSSFVEGYDQPRLMGVAIAIYFPGHITVCLAVLFVVHLGIFSFPSSKSGFFRNFPKGCSINIWSFLSSNLLDGGFQTFFVFHPLPWGMIQLHVHIFQMGWFNHQLVVILLWPFVLICWVRQKLRIWKDTAFCANTTKGLKWWEFNCFCGLYGGQKAQDPCVENCFPPLYPLKVGHARGQPTIGRPRTIGSLYK